MTDIPRARELLCQISEEIETAFPLEAVRIRAITEDLMTRKQSPRRTPIRSNQMTPDVVASILKDLSGTGLSVAQIANKHNVNSGRVSEVLNGIRTVEKP